MKEEFNITFGDGLSPDESIKMSGAEVRRLVRNAFWSGVVATNAIEDVDISESMPPDPNKLPVTIIVTG